jgi:hypothetical protein
MDLHDRGARQMDAQAGTATSFGALVAAVSPNRLHGRALLVALLDWQPDRRL